MKLDLQIFSSPQRDFIFCDFDWQPTTNSAGNTDVYFRKRNDIYLWECGFSTGDTLLESYQIHGEEFAKHIKLGDSSFVLYDSVKEVIIAARDFMGNFPLYYYNSPDRKGSYIFSFSMNSLVKANLFKLSIDCAKVVEYVECNLHTRPNNHTFYKFVYRLLPAYTLRIKHGQLEELKRYGKFNLLKYQSFTDTEYIKRFRELFIKSIKKQTDSYKKIAASLSGGLDSSAVCSVAHSLKDNSIYTFNFKTQTAEAQEDEYVESVVEKWHNIHRTVQSNRSDYEAIRMIIEQNAQPHFVLNHTIQLDLIAAAKQENCDAFLSGHWGDQVVGYGTQYIDELAIAKDWKNLKKAIEQRFQYSLVTTQSNESASAESRSKTIRLFTIRLLWNQVKAKKHWAELPHTIWILATHFNCTVADFFTIIWQHISRKKSISRPKIDELIQSEILKGKDRLLRDDPGEVLDITTTINGSATPTQKRHLDIIFKGNQTYGQEEYFEVYRQNSLRSAQPFFDAELLELSLSVPLRIKFDEGRKRGTLRKALKDYLPEKIANRTTKAVFTIHYVTLFKKLWKDFDDNTADDHPVWKLVNKQIFDKNIKIILDDQHYTDSRHVVMPSLVRVINLAIWLDYLEDLQK